MVKGRKKKIAIEETCVECDGKKLPAVVYGLEGIMSIFHVSKATASRYKNTILKEAIAQNGRVIVVDVAQALKIYGLLHTEHCVVKK